MKYCVMEGKIDNEPRVFIVPADNNKEIKRLRKKGLIISCRFKTRAVLKKGSVFINIVE